MDEQNSNPALEEFARSASTLRDSLRGVIVGQERPIDEILAALFCGGHVLLEGVPGVAKTLLARCLAQSLGLNFRRIQFTPDLMPADVTGTNVFDFHNGRFQLQKGPVFTQVLLADEINRTPPKTQSALLEAMQEYQITSMGQQHTLDKPFIVVATQNPIEQEGTYPLPEAQLDRFMFSLWMDYPQREQEEQIIARTTSPLAVEVEPVFDREHVQQFQRLVRRMPVAPPVVSYATAIARATRPDSDGATDAARQYVEWGAGTRAGQCMILGAKALAVLDGQPAVSRDHVRQIAPAVLRHRVLPNYQAAGDGVNVKTIIERVMSEVQA